MTNNSGAAKRGPTRRQFLKMGAVSAALPLLGACSSDDQGDIPQQGDVGESAAALFDPLKPPTQLITAVSAASVLTLTWSAGSVSSGVPRYQVYVDDELQLETDKTRITLDGFADDRTHAFFVRTIDTDGRQSAPTGQSVREVATPDDASRPPFLIAIPASNGVQFRWAHPTGDGSATPAEYQLFREGEVRPLAVLGADRVSGAAPETHFFATGVLPSIENEYFVVAYSNASIAIGEALNRVRVSAYRRTWPRAANDFQTPGSIEAKQDSDTVTVSWASADPSAIFAYNVFAGDTFVGRQIQGMDLVIPADRIAAGASLHVIAVDRAGYSSPRSAGIGVAGSDSVRARPFDGEFRTDGFTILDPDDRAFIPVGSNMSGLDYFWNEKVIGESAAAAENWRWNTVRIGCGMSDWGAISGGYLYFQNNDLRRIVDEYTSRGIVVILSQFSKGAQGQVGSTDGLLNTAPGSAPDGTGRSIAEAMTDWWVEVAKIFADNPYVWINPINEPGGDLDGLEGQYRSMLSRIRAVAPRTPIVLDAANFANDIPNSATIGAGPVDPEQSFVLSRGPNLMNDFGVARGYGPVMFSIHAYSRWPVNYGGDGRITDEQLAARMRAFVTEARQRGVPFFVGETGVEDWATEYDSASVRVGLYEQGLLDGRPVGVWQEQQVGVLAWHTSPFSGMPVAADDRDWFSVTDVSEASPQPDAGVGLWNYSHSPG
ncbi:cellulase family glycosylhydrolase [Rhodococcus sp. IEGM 1381]|uniref:cellulase family glycosylhydrolase n=1 Tax=Rhodococcus sp. IEGM 1381 TaxID=3047085 RepID=UPI0024B7170C|nr:cellulase family glycosylhydrolase [Rhodococcus sp. IEGM 1381]MDI9894221.1 cellulase family glycosylhydrolase [Rhodococcus sp. IEGM 1381]